MQVLLQLASISALRAKGELLPLHDHCEEAYAGTDVYIVLPILKYCREFAVVASKNGAHGHTLSHSLLENLLRQPLPEDF